MKFRRAFLSDLSDIMQVYKAAVNRMEDMGIHQWDEIYPAEDIIKEDIVNTEMYIGLIDSVIASAFTLSPKHDKQYKIGNWQYDDLRYSVIHRLCVNPTYQNKGVGTQTMNFIEDIFKKENFEAARLDAFSQNPIALKLYKKFGYIKVGEVNWRKGLFYLFEKKL